MRERARRLARTPSGRAHQLCISAKHRASLRSIPFDICEDEVREIIETGWCQATGLPFSLEPPSHTSTNPFSPSLDQIKPGRGYTPENTQVVCTAYNRAKGEYGESISLILARALVDKHGMT